MMLSNHQDSADAPETIPFSKSLAPQALPAWNRADLSLFFKQQISLFATQIEELQNSLLISSTRTPASIKEDSYAPVKRTHQVLRCLEHCRHVLRLIHVLDNPPRHQRFDLSKTISRAWENASFPGQMLIGDVVEPFFVSGDEDQIYLALVLMLIERNQVGREFAISSLSTSDRWELEISDCGEASSANSLAVRTAEIVTGNHGGCLQMTHCPQGGVAFNFVISKALTRRAAA